MASAAVPTIRRIPPPRVYATIPRRRSTNETRPVLVYENDQDHERCFIEENELREINRRQLIRIQFLERDYRQLDDDLAQIQNERDLLIKQKRLLEEELDRSSHHASANVDLHVYTQRLENECRDLRCQISQREKEKFECHEIIADLEIQVKQARDRYELLQETCNELETMLNTETENRQLLEVQLEETTRREKENENQINRLKTELEEIIATKQDIVKSNYALVQNAESLREQLRLARTQAAEVHIIRTSSSIIADNLDESLPCLVYNENGDETPVEEPMVNASINCPSSLFSEINSIETISDEIVTKYLDGTSNDIELDVLLAKTMTFSSILPLINQLINDVKYLHDYSESFQTEQERLSMMKTSLKKVLDNTHVFDARFRKLQLLLIASREQQQCHQAELDDLFRLVDKRLLPDVDQSQQRLISIFEAYEEEFHRLRQLIRTSEETIRSNERDLMEQQSAASRWRMKTTVLEKNQRKLVDKIKELSSERRQLIESSNHKRTRRRAVPMNQPEPASVKISVPERPVAEFVGDQRLRRSRSLPCLLISNHGRKSRNDSGVVLTDDWMTSSSQSISICHVRRRIKSNISSQFVLHTSTNASGCNPMIHSSLSSRRKSRRFQWFFFLFLLFLFSSMKIFCDVLFTF